LLSFLQNALQVLMAENQIMHMHHQQAKMPKKGRASSRFSTVSRLRLADSALPLADLVFSTTVSVINSIVKLMEVDAEENPLRYLSLDSILRAHLACLHVRSILGFSATSNMARALFTIGVTGIGVAVRLLT
jgi:hypothetical protein